MCQYNPNKTVHRPEVWEINRLCLAPKEINGAEWISLVNSTVGIAQGVWNSLPRGSPLGAKTSLVYSRFLADEQLCLKPTNAKPIVVFCSLLSFPFPNKIPHNSREGMRKKEKKKESIQLSKKPFLAPA